MRIRGLILASMGVLLGISCGLGILRAKSYFREELSKILNEEARIACGCVFEADSMEVSLLTLAAHAKNPRVTKDGVTKLHFENLVAQFSLAEIMDRTVLLSELTIRNGVADGVDEDSVTYKMIDHLSTSVPPELDQPDRWKLKLIKVRLHDALARHHTPAGPIEARGISLTVSRTAEDDFLLEGKAKSLGLAINRGEDLPPSILTFGNLSSSVLLLDGKTDFRRIRLEQGQTWVEAQALSDTHNHSALSGSMRFRFNSSDSVFAPVLHLLATGTGSVGGVLSSPMLDITSQTESPGEFNLGPGLSIPIDRINSKFRGGLDNGFASLDVNELVASNTNGTISLHEPLTLRGRKLGGSFQISAQRIQLDSLLLSNSDILVELDGTITEPIFTLAGSIGSLEVGGAILSAVSAKASYSDRKIDLNISHAGLHGGELNLDGQLTLAADMKPHIDQLKIELARLPLTGELALSGAASLQGPIDPAKLTGSGVVTLQDRGAVRAKGAIKLDSGSITADLVTIDRQISATGALSLIPGGRGQISLKADALDLNTLSSDISCGDLAVRANYDFAANAFALGDGQVELNSLNLGCQPFRVSLNAPKKLAIQQGELLIPNLQLTGPDGKITVAGSVGLNAGYDLAIDAVIQLRILLGLISGVDDMSGSANARLKLSGPLNTPKITGSANVDRFEMDIEKSDIAIDGTSGGITLNDDQIEFLDLKGQFNEGTFALSGKITPFDLAESRANLELSRITFAPATGVDGQVSGKLELAAGSDSRKGLISGQLRIDNATIERKLDMRTILEGVAQTLFRAGSRTGRTMQRAEALPDLDLNITVSAPRDLIISTNLMSAELRSNLVIEGTLNSPTVRGSIESISGWFRIKDRRIDITSGIIEFRPGASEPRISVIGEVYLSSLTGDSTLILVEINGTLTNPRVTMTSDRGLSTPEILNLLSSTGSLSDQVLARATDRSMLSSLLSDPDRSLWDEDLLTILPRILSDLTQLDSVNIEPSYSLETGSIDPTVVAIKKITNRVELRGENRFGSTGNDSELAAYYRLSQSVSLVGKIQSDTTDRTTNLELNAVWYGFGRRQPYADIMISGNNSIDSFELKELMRLHDGSRLRPDEVSALNDRLIELYQRRGYFAVSGKVACVSADEFCRAIEISIDEGPASNISAYTTHQEGESTFNSSATAASIVSDVTESLRTGRPATSTSLQRVRQQIVSALRSEGFIAAKVSTSYIPDGSDRKLQILFDPGNPVTFTFEGNTVFSTQDFLKTIDLFGRKQPFGSNTISILIENIERQYSSAGYLYAMITHTRSLDDVTGRVTYLIEIDEGNRAKVSSVRFLELSTGAPFEISKDKIREFVKKTNPDAVRGIFSPRYAVNEELDQNAAILTSAFVNQGYAQATVRPRIGGVEGTEDSSVVVEYQVDLNQKILIDRILVSGMPSLIDSPEHPDRSLTVPALNNYVEQIRQQLIENGFFTPSIVTEIGSEPSTDRLLTVEIIVRPGKQTLVGEITIIGNSAIRTDVIQRHVKLQTGDAWNIRLIEESRRELLKLGGFSQVEIGSRDGDLGGTVEALVVRVVERPRLTFDAGGGANSEYGLHVFGEAIENGLFSDGRNLALRVDGYYDLLRDEVTKGVASLQYSDPFVFDSAYNFTSDLRFQKINLSTQEFDLNRGSLASYFYRSLEDHRAITFGHTFLQDNLSDVNPGAIISDLDTGVVRISFLSGSIIYDQQDDPVNPMEGHKITGNIKLASDAFGSEANFIGLGGRTALRTPFFIRDLPFTFAFNTQIESSWGFGGTDEIPITQRYYLGGRNSIRGYSENSLGPRGQDDAVIGGDLLFANNLELRYRYTRNLILLTFVDAGTVFLKQRSIALNDMRESVGVGMRYLSPIGPIGFDIGHPLNQTNEPIVRVDFNIGSNF